MQRDVWRPVAAFELLAGAARAWIVAAGIGRLVELSQSCPRGATGKPVGMDIARRGGDPVHKGLMARNGILVRVDTQGVGSRLKHFWRRAMAISPANIVALPHISSALKADSSL
jgi:hypothetical protein